MRKGNIIWIAGIIIAIIVIGQGVLKPKEASAGLAANRVFSGGSGPNHVLAGGTIIATYTPETYNYFGVIESVPTDWSPDKTISPDGKVRTTADGTNIVITWTAPATTGNYTFNGEYFVYPDVSYTPFSQDTIAVTFPSVCTSDSQCLPDTECRNWSCVSGTCVSSNIHEGVSCNGGVGKCHLGKCEQGCVNATTDCITPGECQIKNGATCDGGVCKYLPAAAGTTCSGGTCQLMCIGGFCEMLCKSSCIENWSCGDWSSCASDCTQIRICTDLHNCNTNINKPEVARTCTGGECATDPCDECEFYEDCKNGVCKTAGWVIMVFIFFGIIYFMRAMG